ncbi:MULTISPECIES: hypothetical protein [unclassified Caballeronia]|uniref:hypothetical protein n=1 Tax=unclassified Caballeronia TaxID=2646786 RepID=UPI002858BF75|nr:MULTISPECIES: hypothetical protein [unclassified Caballeronia]MDR5772103.1 hypothetical protein [Caballeronia sp. LZ002]MDR5847537.1 hypothetical protein [Caballeronia sp. LZ003]
MKHIVRAAGTDTVLQEAPTFRAACKWLLEVQDRLVGEVFEICSQKAPTKRMTFAPVVEAVFELDGADLI